MPQVGRASHRVQSDAARARGCGDIPARGRQASARGRPPSESRAGRRRLLGHERRGRVPPATLPRRPVAWEGVLGLRGSCLEPAPASRLERRREPPGHAGDGICMGAPGCLPASSASSRTGCPRRSLACRAFSRVRDTAARDRGMQDEEGGRGAGYLCLPLPRASAVGLRPAGMSRGPPPSSAGRGVAATACRPSPGMGHRPRAPPVAAASPRAWAREAATDPGGPRSRPRLRGVRALLQRRRPARPFAA